MKLTNEVGAVLSTLVVDVEARVARIAPERGRLDRRLYLKVNEALEALGGRWSRKLAGHLFDDDPTDAISDAIEAGEVERARDAGFFPTPPSLAEDLVKRAWVKTRDCVLEPSAGEGHLALAACAVGARVWCVEKNPRRAELLRQLPAPGIVQVYEEDFLSWASKTDDASRCFDAAVMNPPFGGRQDLAHVAAAYDHLRPGGKLAAVMSAGISFRQDRRSVEFRRLVTWSGGRITSLPEGTFKDVGTMVRAVVVEMTKRERG